ncbi:acyl-CoA dehydrogenase [Corticibacter populi]|uniref:Acyl-CoA dehydrogenase n=1 Tax=Corticibacter populi TaxID=1550736 RepID=A0A3M6QUS7_9BURK|nr:acyl-CoA dehydrogenase family protein [Corticibacter populi]RMX06641.1 acyl-CoA dehydrogenase [Corticibacter populi]RZS31787.1 acyl-CoA dehydrogenase-like protein [Corticibacter populi]
MFTDAFETFLRGHCTPADVRAIEAGASHQPLWEALSGSGFLELMAAEEAGGAWLDLAGVLPMLSALGYHSVPLPAGQAIALRSLLPSEWEVPDGLPTFAPAALVQTDGSLLAPRVPFGLLAEQVLAQWDGVLWLLDAQAAQRRSCGIAHDASADLQWDAAHLPRHARRVADCCGASTLVAWGAALHAALLAGALTRSFELTLQYGNERSQFGRSIGKFQAIQHQLAVMAEHVAAARMAVACAFPAHQRVPALLPAAMAKARCSEAAGLVASIAHAVHGAIGITEEYDLQLSTRRLHAWRLAHGAETHWHGVVGAALLEQADTTVADFVRELQEA